MVLQSQTEEREGRGNSRNHGAKKECAKQNKCGKWREQGEQNKCEEEDKLGGWPRQGRCLGKNDEVNAISLCAMRTLIGPWSPTSQLPRYDQRYEAVRNASPSVCLLFQTTFSPCHSPKYTPKTPKQQASCSQAFLNTFPFHLPPVNPSI